MYVDENVATKYGATGTLSDNRLVEALIKTMHCLTDREQTVCRKQAVDTSGARRARELIRLKSSVNWETTKETV